MTSSAIYAYLEQFSAAKNALGEALGMSDDLLHVHLGLAIFVLSALVLRRPMRSLWPLTVVAALAVLNEVIDYLVAPRWALTPSLLDLLNTLFWPTLLFLIARRSGPARAVRRRS